MVDKPDTAGMPPAVAVSAWELLRAPFEPHQISRKPQETGAQIKERQAGRNIVRGCTVCGGYHHRDAIHLDYVGHAAVTLRLLEVDPDWDWEPMAYSPEGLPLIQTRGDTAILWIRLIVLGKERKGVGTAPIKKGGDALKELIGDAIRNAAMRFGVALDLWHKGDLRLPPEFEPDPNALDEAQWANLVQLLEATNSNGKAFYDYYQCTSLADFPRAAYDDAVRQLRKRMDSMAAKQRRLAEERSGLDGDRVRYTRDPEDLRDDTSTRPAGEFDEALSNDDIPF